MTRTWHVALFAAIAIASVFAVVTTAEPEQGPGYVVPEGARLSGVVMTTDVTPQPVRRAIVTLSGGGLHLSRNTITDDDGRFEFTNLTPGRFALHASRAGFVTLAHGARRPGRAGTDVVLESGRHVANVHLQLMRGAVITGTVRDINGDPAPGIDVQVERRERNGLTRSGTVIRSDDRGVYRVFGLAPGTHVVSVARQTGSWSPTTGLHAPSDAEVDAELRALQQARITPGQTASSAPASQAASAPRTFNRAPVYHPNALSADDATPIVLSAGEERGGVDIDLLLVSTSAIAGTVNAPPGETMPPTQVELRTPAGDLRGTASGLTPGGSFQFSNIPPGRYVLTASAVPPEARRLMTERPTDSPCWSAMADINVIGTDIMGMALQLQPCPRIAARVTLDGAPPESGDLTGLRIRLLRHGPRGFTPVVFPAPTPPRPDGTVEFGGAGELVPGAYQIAVDRPGMAAPDWWLRSIVLNGQDILDEPFIVSSNTPLVTPVVVTLSNRHTSLAGRLVLTSQQPAVDYTVLAVTTNRAWWSEPFRRVRAVRPATDGGFAFRDLPPGEYFLAALTGVEPDDWLEADFLAQVAAVAVRVTIGEGEQKNQDFQVGSEN